MMAFTVLYPGRFTRLSNGEHPALERHGQSHQAVHQGVHGAIPWAAHRAIPMVALGLAALEQHGECHQAIHKGVRCPRAAFERPMEFHRLLKAP